MNTPVRFKAGKESAGYASFGADYEANVTRATARKLAGMYPLPRMGNETLIAIDAQTKARLYLANLAGHYFVRSAYVRRDMWPAFFGVEVAA